MSWKRNKPLPYWATDIEQVDQGKQQQLMTETLWELWRKIPKHQSVTSQTISTGQRWRHLNQPFEEDLESSNIEAIPQDANHSSVVRIGRRDYNLQRSTEMSHKVLEQSFMRLMRPRLTSTKVMERQSVRKKGSAHDPKHMSSSVKHGGGSVMAWALHGCFWVGSLIFIDDVTHDGSSRMNSEVYKNILYMPTYREMHPN